MRCSRAGSMRLRQCVLPLCAANVLLLLLLWQHPRQQQPGHQRQYQQPELGVRVSSDSLRTLRSAIGNFTWPHASCRRLLQGDKQEVAKALRLPAQLPEFLPDEHYSSLSCAAIRSRCIAQTLSSEEANFPLAFSILVFKDFHQVLKLFRAVYRPEHFYCFHVDIKSADAFYRAVQQLVSCFENVFLAEKRVDVEWGRYSVLEAELVCMRHLVAVSRRWRYFINLTGQEYPLRTLLELVRILSAMDGANNLENAGPHWGTKPLAVRLPNGTSVPVVWHKGSVHVTVSRQFVEFALGEVGQQISEHLRQHGGWPSPDETFFATLQFNPQLRTPGGDLTGLRTDNRRQPYFNRYKNWLFGVFGYPCLSGKAVRQICIWGVRDLPAMNRRFEFFVNKFYQNFQPAALLCAEERFWQNTFADYGSGLKTHSIPLQFYTQFEFVRQHL